jgi:hypothetical protein
MTVGFRDGRTRLIAETQPYPVFMWCRTVAIGAHHACWLLLQALFITAKVPTATTTTATRIMTKGLFIATSGPRPLIAEFSWLKNEPPVNGRHIAKIGLEMELLSDELAVDRRDVGHLHIAAVCAGSTAGHGQVEYRKSHGKWVIVQEHISVPPQAARW